MSGLVTEGLGEAPGGAPTQGFQLTGVEVAANTIFLDFTSGLPPTSVTGPSAVPSNWIVAAIDGGAPVTVLSVAIVGVQIVLTTTNQSGGNQYLLTVPLGIESNGTAMLGPFEALFTGVATTPTIQQAISVEAHLVDVYFSVPPDADLAIDPTQYSCSPTLAVTAVQKVNDAVYRLTTAQQGIGVTYTLTWPA
jgi:hypothetical protein